MYRTLESESLQTFEQWCCSLVLESSLSVLVWCVSLHSVLQYMSLNFYVVYFRRMKNGIFSVKSLLLYSPFHP